MSVEATPMDYALDTETGCWVWVGYRDANGYARDKRGEWAHRSYYRRFKGEIPERHEIDHLCCNPPCVNPDHLEAVTKVEHVRRTNARLGKDDLHARAAYLRSLHLTYSEIAEVLGYSAKASAHAAVLRAIQKGLVQGHDYPQPPNLTENERRDIRELHAMGVPQSELARWYGVDNSNISRTISRARRRRRTR